MKRIGIDVTSALTQGGGIGRYTRELLHALVAQNDHQKRQLHLFSAKITNELPVANPLPTHPQVSYTPALLDERWLYRLWYRARIPVPVQWMMGQVDLFHSPDFVLPPVAAGIPTVLTVHDLSFAHYPEVYTPALVSYLNKVVPWSVTRASHILADSEATKEDLVKLWHVPTQKITVLYSGVNERFRPIADPLTQQQMRERYGLGERPYILSVGTVQPRKNYQLLIRAFAQVAAVLPHNLVIAGGKGWLYDDILAEVKQQGLDGRVIFTGFVDDDDLPTLYSASSLYAFPSLYEGFGLPLLEAMACGIPVINASTSCLPEVAGQATLQIDPQDEQGWGQGMISVLQDETRRAAMISEGFVQVKKFGWTRAAQQLLGVYDMLLTENR